MKKLALRLSELSVESFPMDEAKVNSRGTVMGRGYETISPCFVDPDPRPPTQPSDSWRISSVCEPYTQNPGD